MMAFWILLLILLRRVSSSRLFSTPVLLTLAFPAMAQSREMALRVFRLRRLIDVVHFARYVFWNALFAYAVAASVIALLWYSLTLEVARVALLLSPESFRMLPIFLVAPLEAVKNLLDASRAIGQTAWALFFLSFSLDVLHLLVYRVDPSVVLSPLVPPEKLIP